MSKNWLKISIIILLLSTLSFFTYNTSGEEKAVEKKISEVQKRGDTTLFLQVGAFAVKNNATRLKEKLESNGFDLHIEEKTGKNRIRSHRNTIVFLP